MAIMNNTTKDPYEGLSILDIKRLEYPKWGHTIAGLVILTIGFFGFFENIMVLYTFAKTKQLRSATNIFIIGTSVSDFCMVCLGNPLAWTSALNGKWFAGDFFCHWEGFIVYFFGLSSLYLLTSISVDRYMVISKPLQAMKITKRVAVLAVLGCYGLGLFWAIMPFLGWSQYGLEAPGIYCGLHWEIPSLSNTTYVVTIMFFCFIFPICIMIYSYYNVFMTVRNVSRSTVWDVRSRLARRNLRIEKKMLKTCVIMCSVYWLCWMPYTIVSIWTTFGDPDSIPLVATVIPAIAAKSEVVWNPIIYVASNKQFRKAFYRTIPCTGIRESLVKKEDEKEPSSKESDLDDKKDGAETQVNKPSTSAKNVVDPESFTEPTKVEC